MGERERESVGEGAERRKIQRKREIKREEKRGDIKVLQKLKEIKRRVIWHLYSTIMKLAIKLTTK